MRRFISKKVKVAAMKAYVAEGKTLREVSDEFGINSESLRRWLGDKVRPRGGNHKSSPVGKAGVSGSTNDTKKVRVSKLSPTYSRANYRWSDSENEILRDAVLSKMTIKETTELLGRTPASIMCQKSKLIDSGFISEKNRFIPPTGINRARRNMKTVMSTPEVMAESHDVMVEDLRVYSDSEEIQEENPIELKVDEPINNTPSNDPTKSISNIDLSDLAKIVKEFGVNVTLNVTSCGMEVKMSN